MHRFSSVALVDRRGWLLMQERDEHPVIDPEKWGLPGGSIEPGETPEQAAYRAQSAEKRARELPPRVDYELTDLGRELLVPVQALGDWALKNIDRVNASRERFDAERGP